MLSWAVSRGVRVSGEGGMKACDSGGGMHASWMIICKCTINRWRYTTVGINTVVGGRGGIMGITYCFESMRRGRKFFWKGGTVEQAKRVAFLVAEMARLHDKLPKTVHIQFPDLNP